MSGVEVLVDEDSRLETLRLPHGLTRRIERIVEDSSLGYDSFTAFVLEAVRRQLERAERAAYWLKKEAGR